MTIFVTVKLPVQILMDEKVTPNRCKNIFITTYCFIYTVFAKTTNDGS